MVKCLDDLARITSKKLAITHFVKGDTLQNACSTRRRVVVVLEKSVRMHITLRKGDWQKRGLSPTKVTIDQGNLVKEMIKSWDEIHRNVSNLMHDSWVGYFKT